MKHPVLLSYILAALIALSSAACFSVPEKPADFFAEAPDESGARADGSAPSTAGEARASEERRSETEDASATEVERETDVPERDAAGTRPGDVGALPDTRGPSEGCDPRAEDLPEEVACNGIDDDCDGETDEVSCEQPDDLGQFASCVGGFCKKQNCPASEDGKATQNQDGLAEGDTPCEVTCQAVDIDCNGVDDDCDGVPDSDELCPDTGKDTLSVCMPEGCVAQPCPDGTFDLDKDTSNGCEYSCTPSSEDEIDATCDGVDDDCDGLIDEDHSPEMVTCGLGVCSQAVEKACVEGVLEVCTDEDILSSAQASDDATCDGLDNDCNGETDEDFVPQTISCGEGACAASGTRSCVEGALIDSCIVGDASLEEDTSCNGIDDDCDGETDEDYVGVETSCGEGACAQSFTPTCEMGEETTCVPLSLEGAKDNQCDGIDEDCDGQTDEDAECEMHCLESIGSSETLTTCREFRTENAEEKSATEDATTCASGELLPGRCPRIIGTVNDEEDSTMVQANGCVVQNQAEYLWYYSQSDSHSSAFSALSDAEVESTCAEDGYGIARQCPTSPDLTSPECDGGACLEYCTHADELSCTQLSCTAPTGNELEGFSFCQLRYNASVCEGGSPCETSECPTDASTNEDAEAGTGCVYTPDDTLCDDGDACALEVCDPDHPEANDQGCRVDALEIEGQGCTDRDLCTTGDACDGDGTCVGTKINCGDSEGNTCRVRLCFDGACLDVNANDGVACDPADSCEYNASCAAGECVAASIKPCDQPCGDEDPQTGAPMCNGPASGPTPACFVDEDCDDGYPCTQDTCENASGDNICEHTHLLIPECTFDLGVCCDEKADGEAGCDALRGVEYCVCELQNEEGCCTDTWDDTCIAIAEAHCGLVCGGVAPGFCGDGLCDAFEDLENCPQDCTPFLFPDCCYPQINTGISGCPAMPDFESCACEAHESCCPGEGNVWDDDCIQAAIACGLVCSSACGDGLCDGGEMDTCPEDCEGPMGVCGDGMCQTNESLTSCPEDCEGPLGICGDGVCSTNEDHESCPEDCAPECGNGFCANSEHIGMGQHCVLDCGWCGDFVCNMGENFGPPEGCLEDCTDGAPTCGDGFCDFGEEDLCAQDCEACGDGHCAPGEDDSWCPQDCEGLTCGDGVCFGELEHKVCPWDCPDAVVCDFNDECDLSVENGDYCPDCIAPENKPDTCWDPVCNAHWDAYKGCEEQCSQLQGLPECTSDMECSSDNTCKRGVCYLDQSAGDPVSALTCDFANTAEGTLCDDGNTCTENDMCGGGVCEGTSIASQFCDGGGSCTSLSFDTLVSAPSTVSQAIYLGFSTVQSQKGFIFSLQEQGLKTYDFEGNAAGGGAPSPGEVEEVSFTSYDATWGADLDIVDISVTTQNYTLTGYAAGPQGLHKLFLDSGTQIVNTLETYPGTKVAARGKDGKVAMLSDEGLHIFEETETEQSGAAFSELEFFGLNDIDHSFIKLIWSSKGLYALDANQGVYFVDYPSFGALGGGGPKKADGPSNGGGSAELFHLPIDVGVDTTFIDVALNEEELIVLIKDPGAAAKVMNFHHPGHADLEMLSSEQLGGDEDEVRGIDLNPCGFLAYTSSQGVGVFPPHALQQGLPASFFPLPFEVNTIASQEGSCSFSSNSGAWFALGGNQGGAALLSAVIPEGANFTNDPVDLELKLAGSLCRVGSSVDLVLSTSQSDMKLAYVNDFEGTWKISGSADPGGAWNQLQVFDISESPPVSIGSCNLDGLIVDMDVSDNGQFYLVSESASAGTLPTLLTLPPGATGCDCIDCVTKVTMEGGITPKALLVHQDLLIIAGAGSHPIQIWDAPAGGPLNHKASIPSAMLTSPELPGEFLQDIHALAVHLNRVIVTATTNEGKEVLAQMLVNELAFGEPKYVLIQGVNSGTPLHDLALTNNGAVYALQDSDTDVIDKGKGGYLVHLDPDAMPQGVTVRSFGDLGLGGLMPQRITIAAGVDGVEENANDIIMLADPSSGLIAMEHAQGGQPELMGQLGLPDGARAAVQLGGKVFMSSGGSFLQSADLECAE